MSHGHGDAHGHADAHGHGHETAAHAPSGDPHALPPEPARRAITPAPEDYATTPPVRDLVWPLLWAAVAVALVLGVRAYGWNVPAHEDGHGAPAPVRRAPSGH
jgi:hypothetical protein